MRRELRAFIGTLILVTAAQSQATIYYQRNYSEVEALLKSFEIRYPDVATVVSVGESNSGKIIESIRIGNSGPAHLVVAAHHGNEYTSTELAMAFAEDLARNPILGAQIYIVPVLNISGFDLRQRWEKVGGYPFDPNRDYPGPCGAEGPWELRSTKALADFLESEEIVAAATLHSYYPAVVYPWGNYARDYSTPNDDRFIELAEHAVVRSNYEIGFSGEVIYPADGTFEDYAYWKHGIWSLLFELGYERYPDDRDLDRMIVDNLPGLRAMFENAPAQRALDHEFNNGCVSSLNRGFDPHNE